MKATYLGREGDKAVFEFDSIDADIVPLIAEEVQRKYTKIQNDAKEAKEPKKYKFDYKSIMEWHQKYEFLLERLGKYKDVL